MLMSYALLIAVYFLPVAAWYLASMSVPMTCALGILQWIGHGQSVDDIVLGTVAK